MITFLLFGCQRQENSKVSHTILEGLDKDDEAIYLPKYETPNIYGVYHIKKASGEELVYQLVKGKGYKGNIELLVTIDTSKNMVTRVEILNHKETPSYGGYVTESWFLDRFIDKEVSRVLVPAKVSAKKPEEISIITGATITSEGVINAVNDCMKNYEKIREEIEK